MKKNEKGAVIIEATIALTSFMLFVYLLLTVVNICLAQAKIGVAVNAAAKELSQYCYLYSLTGLDKMSAVAEEKGKLADGVVDNVAEGIETLYDEIGNVKSGSSSVGSALNSGKSAYNSFKNGATTIANDPKEFILSAIYASGNDLFEKGKNSVGAMLAKNLVKKNLRSNTVSTNIDESVESFLRFCRVVPSGTSYIDGLDFQRTEIMPQGTDNNLVIKIFADYDIRIVRLLGVDYTVHLSACGKTQAWAVGEMTAEKQFGSSSGSENEKSNEETTHNENTTEEAKTTSEPTTQKKKTANDYAKESTVNPNSKSVYIGSDARINGDANDGTYLFIENKDEIVSELGNDGYWQVQKEFMQNQIDRRKTFYFTDDPNNSSGDFSKQIQYLKDHDYVIQEGPHFWVAVPASSLEN